MKLNVFYQLPLVHVQVCVRIHVHVYAIVRLKKTFFNSSALSKPVYPVKPNSVDTRHCNLSVVQQFPAKDSWRTSKYYIVFTAIAKDSELYFLV